MNLSIKHFFKKIIVSNTTALKIDKKKKCFSDQSWVSLTKTLNIISKPVQTTNCKDFTKMPELCLSYLTSIHACM